MESILALIPNFINMNPIQALQTGLNILIVAPFIGISVYIVLWFKARAEFKQKK